MDLFTFTTKIIYLVCTYTCFLHSVPTLAPMNVNATRLNDTAMRVSWIPLTIVEARGFVKYVITYTRVAESRKRQASGTKTVNGTESSTVVNDLEPGAKYDVAVGAQTSAGVNYCKLGQACCSS